MIDPVTAIGLATTAYNGIKQAINTGREISEMGSQLGQWAKAMSDLDFAHKQAKNPPMFKKLLNSNIEQEALEAWAHKKKAEEMREELRSYISLYYGPSSWDEIVRIESQMRKQRKDAEYAAIERREKMIEWAVGIAAALVGSAILVTIFYFIGASQGKW